MEFRQLKCHYMFQDYCHDSVPYITLGGTVHATHAAVQTVRDISVLCTYIWCHSANEHSEVYHSQNLLEN